MASKKTLNAKNLEALGAAKLAALLIEISTGDATAKRRLRLELVAAQGPDEVAGEVRKRLLTIGQSCSFVDWRNIRSFAQDLGAQRRAIVEQVAPHDGSAALELMWRFMGLADSIYERCDDGSGTVSDVFENACHGLGEIAMMAKPDPASLAEQVLASIQDNDYGQYDGLIEIMAPALGPSGLDYLKAQLEAPANSRSSAERDTIGRDGKIPVNADDIDESWRARTISMALQAIADVQGDVDGFIAHYDNTTRKLPNIAAAIARRLLDADRAEEALAAVEATEEQRAGQITFEWEQTRLDVLEALGRIEEAQAFRWVCFERSLSIEHLRAYLKRLPDFEDIDAEKRAFDHAAAHSNLLEALAFFIDWADLRSSTAVDRAAALVVQRKQELDGDHYEILTPASAAVAARHPLAATLMLRAMIDFSLQRGRSSRYRHAARHLAECERLAVSIEDFGVFEAHDVYVARLKQEHGRKSSFWSEVAIQPQGSIGRGV